MRELRIIPFTIGFGAILLACQNQAQTETETKKYEPIEVLSYIDTNIVEAVQLPRPNSGTFSFEEAGKHKDEIYDMEPSVKYFNWENPTTGGALHINKNDEIEVYQFTMGMMYAGSGEENGEPAVYVHEAPTDTFFVIKPEDINHHVGGIGFGNPASVLITSEYNLQESKSLELIMNEVYWPATQIFYLKKK